MELLKKAQKYAYDRGDEFWFCHIYTLARTENSVQESVEQALMWLYNDDQIVQKVLAQ